MAGGATAAIQKRTLHIGLHVWAEDTTENAAAVAEARRLTDAIRAKNAEDTAAWRERAGASENCGTVNGVHVPPTVTAVTATTSQTSTRLPTTARHGGAGRGAAAARPRGAAGAARTAAVGVPASRVG